jgi:hypothetical protein
MTDETSRHYEAWKSPKSGRWYVRVADGELVSQCDCQFQAEEIANDLNDHVARERARHCSLPDPAILRLIKSINPNRDRKDRP